MSTSSRGKDEANPLPSPQTAVCSDEAGMDVRLILSRMSHGEKSSAHIKIFIGYQTVAAVARFFFFLPKAMWLSLRRSWEKVIINWLKVGLFSPHNRCLCQKRRWRDSLLLCPCGTSHEEWLKWFTTLQRPIERWHPIISDRFIYRWHFLCFLDRDCKINLKMNEWMNK